MEEFAIGEEDPRSTDVAALLDVHLEFARTHTPPDDVHALPVEGLMADDVTLFGLRDGARLLAVGALRQLEPAHAEIKSMHTAQSTRGRGLGRAMLEHLVAVARTRGCERVSLETGTMDAFAAARRLYESAGFERCEPFADYPSVPNSVCMTLALERRPPR